MSLGLKGLILHCKFQFCKWVNPGRCPRNNVCNLQDYMHSLQQIPLLYCSSQDPESLSVKNLNCKI